MLQPVLEVSIKIPAKQKAFSARKLPIATYLDLPVILAKIVKISSSPVTISATILSNSQQSQLKIPKSISIEHMAKEREQHKVAKRNNPIPLATSIAYFE